MNYIFIYMTDYWNLLGCDALCAPGLTPDAPDGIDVGGVCKFACPNRKDNYKDF